MIVFIIMSGLFTPVESMPVWAQNLDKINPVYYLIRIIRNVVLKGSGLLDMTRGVDLPLALWFDHVFAGCLALPQNCLILSFKDWGSIDFFYIYGLGFYQPIDSVMVFKKYIYLLTISLICIKYYSLCASDFAASGDRKTRNPGAIHDLLSWSLSLVKKVFNGSGEWYMTNPSFQKTSKEWLITLKMIRLIR